MEAISDIYFVGGFGTVAWVDVTEYTTSKPDIIAATNPEGTLMVRRLYHVPVPSAYTECLYRVPVSSAYIEYLYRVSILSAYIECHSRVPIPSAYTECIYQGPISSASIEYKYRVPISRCIDFLLRWGEGCDTGGVGMGGWMVRN